MGIVKIETNTRLPEDLRRQIQSLNGGKHGMRPQIKGDTIICGRTIHTLITQIIESKPDVITITKAVVVDKQGQEHLITRGQHRKKGKKANQPQSTVLFRNPELETPKKALTPQEQFEENLEKISDERVKKSLCNVLESITESVNNDEEEDKLQPYHLVSFREKEDGTVEPSLGPLEAVDPELARSSKRYILAYKNCGGDNMTKHLVEVAIAQFGENLFHLVEDPNRLQQLKGLTKVP